MRLGKKITGGRFQQAHKRKKRERPGEVRNTKIGERKKKNMRVEGGNQKSVLLRGNKINIVTNGKTKVSEIKNVVRTPSNRFLARQNILTKGAIVETEQGNAKITNRPSQEGNINGVLVEE